MQVTFSSHKYARLFSVVLFSIFYALLLFEFIAIVQNSSAKLPVLLLVVPFFILTLFSSFWGAWLFVAAIPFLNGLLLINGGGDVALAFSGVYFAWFPKQLVGRKTFCAPTLTAFFTCIF